MTSDNRGKPIIWKIKLKSLLLFNNLIYFMKIISHFTLELQWKIQASLTKRWMYCESKASSRPLTGVFEDDRSENCVSIVNFYWLIHWSMIEFNQSYPSSQPLRTEKSIYRAIGCCQRYSYFEVLLYLNNLPIHLNITYKNLFLSINWNIFGNIQQIEASKRQIYMIIIYNRNEGRRL